MPRLRRKGKQHILFHFMPDQRVLTCGPGKWKNGKIVKNDEDAYLNIDLPR